MNQKLSNDEYKELIDMIENMDNNKIFNLERYKELISIVDMSEDEYREYRINKLI